MRIARLKIALFALFLATPVLALLAVGGVPEYGARHPDFPRFSRVLIKQGMLDQFGDAVLSRSAARKLAIGLRSWIGYDVVGFVDTRLVVSGEAGWLFYRNDFARGRCLDERVVAERLAQLGTLTDMARAAGTDMIVSLSPDKSAIYPEYLHRFARGYWRCRTQNADALRRLMRLHAPRLIDHAEAILAEKRRNPAVPLYYAADTHWTPYGGALALRQLLERVFSEQQIALPGHADNVTPYGGDLARMLLLSRTEHVDRPDPAWEAGLAAFNRDPAGTRTAILRDSFYDLLRADLNAIFPTATNVSFEESGPELIAPFAAADRVIVNSVERGLLPRIEKGPLDRDSPLAEAVMQRNRARAAACGGFASAAGGEVSLAPAQGEAVISLPVPAAGDLPCLRMSLAVSGSALLELSWAAANGNGVDRTFWLKLGAADHVVAVVLPADAAGADLHLRAKAKKKGSVIFLGGETGSVPPLPLLSGAR